MNIKDKIVSLRIKLLFWFSLVGPSVSVPFFGLYFRKILESHSTGSVLGLITLLLSLQPLLSIFSSPVAGYIGDKFKIENRILLFCSILVAIGGAIIGIPAFFINPGFSLNLKFIFLCTGIIIIGLFGSPIVPLINTETIEFLHKAGNNTSGAYGRYRLYGTYSWIFFTILIGLILFITNEISILILFYCGGFILLALIAFSGIKSKIKPVKIPYDRLKKDKPFKHLIIFTFIQAFGFYGSMIFTGYFFEDIHMNYFFIGMAFALSALLEVPAMLNAKFFLKKLGNRTTILIGTIILMFKVLLLGVFASSGKTWLMILPMLLHGLGFGLQLNGIIEFIDKRAHKDLRATYMNLYNMFGILVPMALGALFCGWIIHVLNSTWMMLIESFIVIIGILYFIFFVIDD